MTDYDPQRLCYDGERIVESGSTQEQFAYYRESMSRNSIVASNFMLAHMPDGATIQRTQQGKFTGEFYTGDRMANIGFTALDSSAESQGYVYLSEPDTVTGSPTHIPPIDDDDKEYTVRAMIPTDGFKRAAKLIDMKASVARFVMSPDGFLFEADGDTDDISIDAADTDAFEWIDKPDETAVSRQSVNYMKEIMREFDEDTVEVISGDDHPYHVLTTRGPADRRVVDTHFVTAPRLDTT